MKNNAPRWMVVGSAVLVVAATACGLSLAEERPPSTAAPVHFMGLINDYTPSAAVTKGGPYEMRGKWSLDIDERRGAGAVLGGHEHGDLGLRDRPEHGQQG